MKLPEIVGVAGTNASGKDTLGALRQALQNAKFVSLSDIIRHELDQQGLPHERSNLSGLANKWRAESGAGVLVLKSVELYRQEKLEKQYSGLTLTSIRHPKEAEEIQALGGIVIWIDADPRIRYQRVLKREGMRPEDQKTYEQFVSEENAEMQHVPGDDSSPNMGGVRDIADLTLINDFETVEEYEAYLKEEFKLS